MTTTIESAIGTSGLQALVHKQDVELTITIDPLTGLILTPVDERPEWAEELSMAQVAERHQFYVNNLGEGYTADMKMPGVMAFEDLGWLCSRSLGEDENGEPRVLINEDGTEDNFELYTIDADLEHRNSVVATVLGVPFNNETGEYEFNGEVEVAIAADNERTPEEVAELESSQAEHFKAVNE